MKPYYQDESVIIYNGNCQEVIPKLDQKFAATITSPPYNMRIRVSNNKYIKRENVDHFSKKYQDFGDDLPIGDYYNIHTDIIFKCLSISDTCFWNIQLVTGSKAAWFDMIGKFSINIKDIVIWDKGSGQPAMHEAVLNRSYEMILIMEGLQIKGRQFAHSTFKRGTMPDVWRIGKQTTHTEGHAASMPIDLPIKIIDNWSKPNDWILDPFGGTGTTARAAKDLGRKCVMIELSEKYCEIAANRMKQEVFNL
jgi:DNA modification methylase